LDDWVIPKPLPAIAWSDILALKDSGREEDDTIEYKSSFSCGQDFLAVSDQQRKNATDDIAREVVAFLNGRGGDVLIGVKEASNENPVIETITPLANVLETADRLDSAIAALIEPKQAIIGVRAIRLTDVATDGVIVIRAPSSLRAPHRTSRDKECYIRRGSKSVPMPMDEIQDVTLGRAMRRSERNAMLDRLFIGHDEGKVGSQRLPHIRCAVRLAFVPEAETQIVISPQFLETLHTDDGRFYCKTIPDGKDFGKFEFDLTYRPALRGIENTYAWEPLADDMRDYTFRRLGIGENGTLTVDYAACSTSTYSGQVSVPHIPSDWIISFLGGALRILTRHSEFYPLLCPGTVRVSFEVAGDTLLSFGRYQQNKMLPTGVTAIPDFSWSERGCADLIFAQLQKDLFNFVGIRAPEPWSLTPP
jgi:Putative DNA-binding domain